MAGMTKEVIDAFNDTAAVKTLTTVDKEGKINVVPLLTLMALDGQNLVFADLFIMKTKANLKATKKANALVFTVPTEPGAAPKGFQVKGTFTEWHTSGPIFDMFNPMVRQMMKRGVRAVGFIKVDEAYEVTMGSGGAKVA